jgi:hypothetical protein
MRLALKAILIVGGIAAVLIGVAHIALGSASIPGSLPVNVTMDSEDGFYAAIFWDLVYRSCGAPDRSSTEAESYDF